MSNCPQFHSLVKLGGLPGTEVSALRRACVLAATHSLNGPEPLAFIAHTRICEELYILTYEILNI